MHMHVYFQEFLHDPKNAVFHLGITNFSVYPEREILLAALDSHVGIVVQQKSNFYCHCFSILEIKKTPGSKLSNLLSDLSTLSSLNLPRQSETNIQVLPQRSSRRVLGWGPCVLDVDKLLSNT